MIEIVYHEDGTRNISTNQTLFLPNNIRQIGECNSNFKIYLEDYVYTYLKRLSNENQEEGHMLILLGECKKVESSTYVFIKSALDVKNDEVTAEHLRLGNSQWSEICQEAKQYFPEQEVVGWSLVLPGFDMKITDEMLRMQMDCFSGEQKVLFVFEAIEKEEAFFVFENGNLKKQKGYYIFYEKNNPMQSYMIEKFGNRSIDDVNHATDRAVMDFRKLVADKQEDEKRKNKRKSYVTGACAVIAVVILGITWSNHQITLREIAQETTQSEVLQEEKVVSITPTQEINKIQEVTPTPQIEQEIILENEEEQQETSVKVYQKYEVRRGDTLTKISEKYYGNIQMVQEICEINALESEDLIYTGQIILLP